MWCADLSKVGDTQGGLDEGLQSGGLQGGAHLRQRTPQHAEVDRTNDRRIGFGHLSEGAAMEQDLPPIRLPGRMRFTADGEDLEAGPGFWLHMAPGTPHALTALEPTMMLLTLVKR